MSSDSSSPRQDTEYCYDSENRLCEVRRVTNDGGSVVISCIWDPEPPAPLFSFQHDTQKRLFVLSWPDGKTEHFRDSPVRHLMVEPDPQTGAMRPVIKLGKPAFVCLSREEREV